MNSKIKCSFRNISLWALTSLLSVPTLLQAQTSYNYIQTITDQYWGNGTNWSPTSIPNGTDVVVNVGIASANPNCSNTAENEALSNSVPNFPYVFGRLNLTASTTIGVTAGSTTERLRAAVSTGTPIIDCQAGANMYCTLIGNQGLYFTNSAQSGKLCEFRYNTATMQVTGMVEIATGAILEENGDYTLGNPTNILQIDNGGTWSSRSSASKDFTPATRQILLNSPNLPAQIGTYSTYPWTIAGTFGEATPGSSLEMPGTIGGSTTYGAGVITMTASNTFSGAMIVAGGTLDISNQFAFPYATFTENSGTVLFDKGISSDAFYVGGLAGTGYLVMTNTASPGVGITLTAGGNNASTAYSGRLLGSSVGGTLVKIGIGTLDLQGSGDNSYGVLNVSNGIVMLDKNSTASVHANGGGVILNGGTVQLAGSGGDQIYNNVGVAMNSGILDLNGQTETIANLSGLGGSIEDSTMGASAILTVNVPSGSVTNGSTLTGGNLVFGGPGTQVFIGADSRDAFTSGLNTTVSGGTLQLGNGGAVVPFGGSEGITLTAPGTLALNGTGTFANNISGSGNLAINTTNTITLADSDTHTGNTMVNSGTLELPSGVTTAGGEVITISSNAALNVGTGTLTLNGGQTVTGAGTVLGSYSLANGATNSGTLTFNGNVTFQAGAVLNPGSPSATGTITNHGSIINSGSYELVYYLTPATTPGGGTNALLVVSGNLDMGSGANAASVVINGAPTNGTYVLATFGTFSGTLANVAVSGPSGRQTYTLRTSGNQLQLVVGGESPQILVWQGDGTANAWDANDTANQDWFNSALSASDYFGQGDTVNFDNSSTNLIVNLTGDLLPQLGSVVTVNSTNNFTFTGGGFLDGAVTLTKTNTGVLTLQTANTFTGPVNLNGGVVSVGSMALNGSPSPLGAGSALVFNGGTLQYTGENANSSVFNRSITIGQNGATLDIEGTADSAYLYVGSISGSGSLTKMGTNELVVTGNNAGYTNVTYVLAGQLQLQNVNGLGSGSSMVIATNNGAVVATGGGLSGTVPKAFTLGGAGDGNGVLQANSSATVNFAGAINLITNASIGGSGSSNVLSGVISGGGSLTMVGSGSIALAANNTYAGGTVISNGVLQLGIGPGGGNNGWLPAMPASWVLTNNGCLAINHTNATVLTNGEVGTGWINQIGTGTVTMGASNNFSGGIVFNHPSIGFEFTGAAQIAGPVLVTNSYAFGTVGAETGVAVTSRLKLSGNINLAAPIAEWSTSIGFTNIENVSGTNSLPAVLGIYGNTYWPLTSDAGLLNVSIFSNAVYNSTYTRVLQLQGAGNGVVSNTIDPSYFFLQIEKDGAGTWWLENSIDAPAGLLVNAGTLILDGNLNAIERDQNISHTVNGGTLIVNGSLPVGYASGNLAVNNGQLGGVGVVEGTVTVAPGAAVSPSACNGTNTSLLTVVGNLTLGGNVVMAVNKALVQSNDFVNVGGTLANTGVGSVTVTNNGPVLLVGDSFTLFSEAVANGAALTINPVVRGGVGQFVTWSNHLALDGGISVLTVAPLGTNAYLTSLALTPADNLTPAFATNVFLYYATNAYGVAPTVTVTNANLTSSNALIVNGTLFQVLTSGVPSLTLTNLGIGSTNVVKVMVTAQDGVTTNLYTVDLTGLAQRALSTNALLVSLALNPALSFAPVFASNIWSYGATEMYGGTPTVTVTNADLTATNQLIYNGSAVGVLTSGVPSGPLILVLGTTNVVNVLVTAQNGVTTNLYALNVVEHPSQTKPVLTNSVNGTAIKLSWPADHLGYRLLVQTNNLQNGVSDNPIDWGTVAGSTAMTTTNLIIVNTNSGEFYRLVYP